MTRERWSPFAGAAASAVLLGLYARAEAPFVPLGFVGLVPWLLALDRARSFAAAIGSAAVAAAIFAAVGFSWFPAAIAGYSGGSPALAWLIALLLAPVLLAPQFLALAAARRLAARLGAGRAAFALVSGLAWVGAEWALPRVFADTLGYGLHPWEGLRQAADIAGARGLTLLLLVANECVAMSVAGRRVRPVAVAALFLAAALGYGHLRERQIDARVRIAPTYTAAVVQANITRYDKLAATRGTFAAVAQILDTHFALSQQVIESAPEPPDLLVWPETVYPTTFGAPRTGEAAGFDRAIDDMVAGTSVPLVLGAFEREGGDEFNAAFFVTPRAGGGVDHQSYRKTVLFPLTEYVPGWLDSEWLRRALPWTGRWAHGPGPRTVRFALRDGTPIAAVPLICYEVTEPGYVAAGAARGADLLLTISNDAWFPDAAGPRLHLIVAAFRSIETRLPQVRATNSGLSALISPTGELEAVTEFAGRTAFRVQVPRPAASWTLVVAWGDWLGLSSLVVAAALLGWAFRASRRRTRLPGSAPTPRPPPRRAPPASR
jgi:apolipoprotein N-acyltransferase